jgi:hemerythrin
MQTLTFRDEADFMQKLHYYVYNQHRLTSTTLFCRIKITNFYTLDKHETMIETVTYFLRENSVNNKVTKISIMTIKNLLQLFLYNNLFRYKNKIYTIIKGSPNTMPLSDLLSNIYLFDWQQRILKEVKRKNELFGR